MRSRTAIGWDQEMVQDDQSCCRTSTRFGRVDSAAAGRHAEDNIGRCERREKPGTRELGAADGENGKEIAMRF